MVGEESGSNGGSSIVALRLEAKDCEAVKKVKGCPVEAENGDGNTAGSSTDVLWTYKRRKHTKVVDAGKVSGDSCSQVSDKSIKESLDTVLNRSSWMQAGVVNEKPHGLLNGSSDRPVRNWKNVVLEQIFQSLQGEGGLKECILEALSSHPDASCAAKFENSCEDEKRHLPSHFVHQFMQDGMKAVSNGSVHEPSLCRVTELCQHMFIDVVKSQNFTQLCNILFENFEGMKVDKFFDISHIHTRMKDKSYEGSPLLFHSDIQRMWMKLHQVGSEIVDLSKSLSERSRASFWAQMAGSMHEISGSGKNEFIIHESDMLAKAENGEACGMNKACACRCCGEKADGRDCLVCDSCEQIYHVACIEPAVKEIPLRSWYCARCTSKSNELLHENCVVCERLNASGSPTVEDGVDELLTQDMHLELESPNGSVDDEVGLFRVKNLPCCSVCKAEVKSNENFRVCGHSFCPHKFYHERCLTKKLLDSFGSCWYCPSCLCRACLKDRDDDKIVLCDGCDHAYHIYCMQPPRTSIPRGKWFCQKCNREIQHIRKTKRTFENLQYKLRKRAEEYLGLGVPKDEALKSGGVDMLLSAAKTLNYQENLAAMELKG